MTLHLRLTGDQIVHHENLDVSWLATLCGLRMDSESRTDLRFRLKTTSAPVNCMTCLVLKARR